MLPSFQSFEIRLSFTSLGFRIFLSFQTISLTSRAWVPNLWPVTTAINYVHTKKIPQ
jgi:hypothetical protein